MIKAMLGYTSDNPKTLIKNCLWANEITIKPTGDVNDLTCDFVLDGTDFYRYNYLVVYWPGLQGGAQMPYYYFINKKIGTSGNRTILQCELDVLNTFNLIIGNSPAVISRTSNSEYVNFFVRDNKVPVVSTTQISTKNFGPDILPQNAQEYIYVGIWQSGKAHEEEEGS